MSPIARAGTAALLEFVWQGAAVGIGLSLTLALLSKRSANLRYLACCAAMIGLALLPVVTGWHAYSGTRGPDSGAAFSLVDMLPTMGDGMLAALQAWAIPIWSVGVALLSLRFMGGWWQVTRLRGSITQASSDIMEALAGIQQRLDLHGRASVAVAALADGPVVIGVWRPMILLPVTAAVELTRDQLEAVLAHEAAHIRRHDYAVNVAQTIVETFLFYHPATWWVSSRMRRERELCCDDAAVAMSGDRVAYARGLVKLEQLRLSGATLAVGATGVGGALSRRIRRILGESPAAGWPTIAIALAGFALLACVGSSIDSPRHEARTAAAGASVARSPAIAEDTTSAIASTERARVDEPIVGRRLARIHMSGVSAEARQRIALPVRIGDMITVATRGQVAASLERVDAHLGVDMFALPAGQAAVVITRSSRN
jgi:Zn-dependent protease with chaperone function